MSEQTTQETHGKTPLELINLAFEQWNSMKRSRALADEQRMLKNYDQANLYSLKMYQASERFELYLRALQNRIKYPDGRQHQ